MNAGSQAPDLERQVATPGLVRLGLLAILGLVLGWLVLTRTLGEYLSEEAPGLAMQLRLAAREAFLVVTDRRLTDELVARDAKGDTSGLARDPEAVAARRRLRPGVEAAIVAEPLDPRGYRLLGLMAEAEGDQAAAERFLKTSARVSRWDGIAHLRLLRTAYAKGEYADAATYADILLRTRRELLRFVTPSLARMAEMPAARGEVIRVLRANPPWRTPFFHALTDVITDSRTPLRLFEGLRDGPTPPTAYELSGYLPFLMGLGYYRLAHDAWITLLPPEQARTAGFLFNGGFEHPLSNLPFDWVIKSSEGVNVEVLPRRDAPEGKALAVEFGHGRIAFPEVSETIMLPPGAYRLSGSYSGRMISRRGLHWSVACNGGATLAESEPVAGIFDGWRGFEFSFTVPEKGCPLQKVRLDHPARSASEQMASGLVWFDDLKIDVAPAR